jgi:hypothetical protein
MRAVHYTYTNGGGGVVATTSRGVGNTPRRGYHWQLERTLLIVPHTFAHGICEYHNNL